MRRSSTILWVNDPSWLLGLPILRRRLSGVDGLMMQIYAAMAPKEQELISERTRAALAAAKARGAALGADTGYRPAEGSSTAAAALARRAAAAWAAHRLALDVERLRAKGVTGQAAMARALTERRVPMPQGGAVWTHTTVRRAIDRVSR